METTNRGTTFAPVFDKELTQSIGSVVVEAPASWGGWAAIEEKKKAEGTEPPAPVKSEPVKSAEEMRVEKGKSRIVWVGTGERNGRNRSSFGSGVYRSIDGRLDAARKRAALRVF